MQLEYTKHPCLSSRNYSSWKTSRNDGYICLIKCEFAHRNAIEGTTQSWKQGLRADNTKPSQYTKTVWNEGDSHKIRKFPIPNDRIHTAFYLKKHARRVLSMKCSLDRFPANPHLVREKIGAIGKIVLEKLHSILPHAVWSKQDTCDVIGATDAILEHLP